MIKEADLVLADWPGTVPPTAMKTKEDIIGRGVVSTIYDREPIVETRLAAKGAGAGFAASIPEGMRAVAVHVNDVVGVAGFAVPGMRVDVLIAGNPPISGNGSSGGTMVKTLLQNLQVLSAGQNFQHDAEGKPISVAVVNLLVNPEQAEILSLASNETRIQLVLRNPIDQKVSTTKGVAMGQLFGERPAPVTRAAARPAAPPPAPRAEPPAIIEIISGTRRSQATFIGENR
jgi:pilus assembly protein CpaB